MFLNLEVSNVVDILLRVAVFTFLLKIVNEYGCWKYLKGVVMDIFEKNKIRNEFWKHFMAIPGPKGWPIIGNGFNLDTPEEIFNGERHLSEKYFPIYKKHFFHIAIVTLMDPEDVKLVLNNTKHNSKSIFYKLFEDWIGSTMFTCGGEKWHRRRKLLTPAFHYNILEDFMEIFKKETVHFVETLKKEYHKPYIKVMNPVTSFTLFSIGEAAFNSNFREDPKKCEAYMQAVHDYGEDFMYRVARPWLLISFLYNLSPSGRKHKKTVKTLTDFSVDIIREKKKILNVHENMSENDNKRIILMDLLLRAKNNGDYINDEGIKDETNGFIFAGHDTTGLAICHILMVIANEQEAQETMYQEILSVIKDPEGPSFANLSEIKFVERCIKECLRLYPSGPIISRLAGEDIKTKSGYTIPKGCNIRIPIYDLHRNPIFWKHPSKFDPDRFLPENIAKRHTYSYIPFSGGSRNCLGQKYVMMELKVVLSGILRNFKLEPVTKPEDLRYKSGIVLRPSCEIKVKFIPRK